LHFVNTGKYAAVPDDVMRDVRTILDSYVIANIAGNDSAVPDSSRDAKIVVLKKDVSQRPDAYEAVKG